ncbi:MAG: homoserine kinase [Anaerolineaceae bacterium]
MSFRIRVPATTANLGPGFDCLGLALDLWNEVEAAVSGSDLKIEIDGVGRGLLPVDHKNAIYRAMEHYAERHRKELPSGVSLSCMNRIPLGSGMGSSAAAAVAGILAAAVILDIPRDIEDQLACAAQIEGHPDNAAPCLLGGLVASSLDNGKVIAHRLPISDFYFVIVHPFFTFPTHAARAALPKQVPHGDAVTNAGHVLLLSEALRSGDVELLAFAMQDRLHEPYRLPLIPGASSAIAAAKSAGAITVVLSGAGPSLLAFSPSPKQNQEIALAMQAAFTIVNLKSEVFYPSIAQTGAEISPG